MSSLLDLFNHVEENLRLEQITKKYSKKNLNLENLKVYSINNKKGFVSQEDQFEDLDSEKRGYDLSIYKIVDEKTFGYNPSRINVGSIGFYNGIERVIVSSLYVTFRALPKVKNEYLAYFFESTKFKSQINKYSEGGVRLYLFYENFKKISLNLHSFEIQKKIASFLSSVDKKIELLTKKHELLEKYKKGLMQKIFSQDIRFRQDDGSDFPDWESKSLNEFSTTFVGLSGKSGSDFGSGKKYIQYTQIFKDSKIDISDCGLVDISRDEKQNKVKRGDIFFTTSSETPNEVAYSSVILEEIDEVYLNSFCFGMRLNSHEEVSPSFARHLFRDQRFRKIIFPLAQGSTRYNISKTNMMKLNVEIPSILEQNKISNILDAIEEKLSLNNKVIEKTQTFKKGLLQQMFV